MFINRVEPRVDRVPEKLRQTRQGAGEQFARTIESLVEVDVVEIGDSTEDQKKQNSSPEKQKQEQKTNKDAPAEESGGLDIKV